MPILRSALKKMRQDKKRADHNKIKKDELKALIKAMRKTPNLANLAQVSSALDKAVKTNFIHRNKANRLKSRLAHLVQS